MQSQRLTQGAFNAGVPAFTIAVGKGAEAGREGSARRHARAKVYNGEKLQTVGGQRCRRYFVGRQHMI